MEQKTKTPIVKGAKDGHGSLAAEMIRVMANLVLALHILVALLIFYWGYDSNNHNISDIHILIGMIVGMSALPFWAFWNCFSGITLTLNAINEKLAQMNAVFEVYAKNSDLSAMHSIYKKQHRVKADEIEDVDAWIKAGNKQAEDVQQE